MFLTGGVMLESTEVDFRSSLFKSSSRSKVRLRSCADFTKCFG